jgi:mono/diheme cytochrome c family protein
VDRMMKVLGISVFLAAAYLIFMLLTGTGAITHASPAPQGSAQDVYLDKCSVCHGKDGSGNTAKGKKLKAKDLRSAEIQKMSDADLIDAVANGKGKDMDGFQKELGADMVKQLVAYCRTLKQ